jgi:hypothetical protein
MQLHVLAPCRGASRQLRFWMLGHADVNVDCISAGCARASKEIASSQLPVGQLGKLRLCMLTMMQTVTG